MRSHVWSHVSSKDARIRALPGCVFWYACPKKEAVNENDVIERTHTKRLVLAAQAWSYLPPELFANQP